MTALFSSTHNEHLYLHKERVDLQGSHIVPPPTFTAAQNVYLLWVSWFQPDITVVIRKMRDLVLTVQQGLTAEWHLSDGLQSDCSFSFDSYT